jgi:ATP-dependent DNA helicase RecQ
LVEDLERFGHLERTPEGVAFRGDPAVAMEAMAGHQQVQIEVEESRLDMVAAYAETTTCRRRYLLNYLGDEYPAELCLRCDECLRTAGERGPEDWDLTSQQERIEEQRGGPFAVGDGVRHGSWGDGVIQRVDGDVLVVRFETVGYRSMHAPTVLERALLEPTGA